MATNSDIPVGFQIAGIFIPVVAAIVTGILALVTGRKHTTERLKNLVEASKELPETLNVKHAMERVMLTYVRDIDRYASSWFRNSVKLSVVTIVSCLVIALLVRFSEQLKLSTTDRRILVVGYIAILVIWAAGFIVTLFRDSLPFDKAYEARFKGLGSSC